MANAPFVRDGMARAFKDDLPDGQSEIFFPDGLDSQANQPVLLSPNSKCRDGRPLYCRWLLDYPCVMAWEGLARYIMKTFLFAVFASQLLGSAAAAAQLNVLMSGGFGGAYEQLLPEFERISGIKVTTGSGASQGKGPQTIAAQLARGVPADVVILSREGLTELIAANRIAAGTDVDLAQVPLGVAVRAGTAKPDVSTVEAFKQTMLKAGTVAVPGSTSGIWLTTDLFPRLGLAEKIEVKTAPRGSEAAGMVAAGAVNLAVMPTSEILHAPGVDLAGNIAPEIQFVQTFSAAVVAGSGAIEGSKRLIEFLASARAAEAIKKSGMELPAKAR
jgi:molybdate transport system substrate-binding protein